MFGLRFSYQKVHIGSTRTQNGTFNTRSEEMKIDLDWLQNLDVSKMHQVEVTIGD